MDDYYLSDLKFRVSTSVNSAQGSFKFSLIPPDGAEAIILFDSDIDTSSTGTGVIVGDVNFAADGVDFVPNYLQSHLYTK